MPPPRHLVREVMSQAFIDRVAGTIGWRLRARRGRCTVEVVAGDLQMPPATLRWRLARRGASFAKLLRAGQIRLVTQVLADPEVPLKYAHVETGFANREGLAKWCRRVLGATPSQVRRRLMERG